MKLLCESERRIQAIVQHLRSALPTTELVLLGILPRGWRGPTHFGVRPEKGLWYDWPNPFTPVSSNKRPVCAVLFLILLYLDVRRCAVLSSRSYFSSQVCCQAPGCFKPAVLLHRASKKSMRA